MKVSEMFDKAEKELKQTTGVIYNRFSNSHCATGALLHYMYGHEICKKMPVDYNIANNLIDKFDTEPEIVAFSKTLLSNALLNRPSTLTYRPFNIIYTLNDLNKWTFTDFKNAALAYEKARDFKEKKKLV